MNLLPPCPECGGPVSLNGQGRPRRFCTETCKRRAGNRRLRRTFLPLRDPDPQPRKCAHCGNEFIPKKRDSEYCYEGWCVQAAYQKRKRAGAGPRMVKRDVTCDGCGTVFVGEHPNARWCSKRCANRHWGLVRSRQRRKPSVAKYTDREIFERDDWVCHICKKRVWKTVDRLHPMGATIDHLVPISLGGEDEPRNMATAHWKCNREKRAGAVNDQLRLT